MVEISTSLRRAAKQEEWSHVVLVRSPGSTHEVTAVVASVVAQAMEGDDDVDAAIPLEVQQTMKGPAVVLSDVDDPGEVLPTIERLAERLEAAGLGDATLTVLPSANPWGRDEVNLVGGVKCWMVLRGTRPADWPSGGLGWSPERPVWDVSDVDRDHALTDLADWVVALPERDATGYVSSGTTYVPVPPSQVLAFMRHTEAHPSWLRANLAVVAAGRHFRSIDVNSRYGLAAAYVGERNTADLDWRAALDDARQLIASLGDWCIYAHLTRTTGSFGSLVHNPDGDRNIGNPLASQFEDFAQLLDGGRFFDAYPVMRLPAARRPLVEGEWSSTPTSATHLLATHPNLDAWFGQPRIDEQTLRHARAALGTHVLDRTSERLHNV